MKNPATSGSANGRHATLARTPRRLWLAMLAAVTFATLGVLVTDSQPEAALQTPSPISVDLASVTRSSVYPTEHAVGRLLPARRATLRFEVPGRVVRRLAEPGKPVTAGEPLIQLADEDARARVTESESQYTLEHESIARDRRLLELAERNTALQGKDVKRLDTLKAQSLTSLSQLDGSRQSLLQLEAEAARLRHSVTTASSRLALRETQRELARRELARTTLRAPFAGTVNRVDVEVGDFVSPEQPAAELVDLAALDLHVEVRGDAVQRLELGQPLPVTVAGRELPGTLQSLQVDPDPSTFTHALRIRLSGRQLRPGALAAVRLPLPSLADALVVPASGILNTEGSAYIFLYGQGRLRRTPVTLGPRLGDLQVVKGEVAEGDRVVSRNVAGLGDGQVVQVASGAL